jgi:hypothetical protein
MDTTIRRNSRCVIGQPSCDFVFSSTRDCFIAYGFNQSTFEMTILRNLLEKRGVQAIEAGGVLAPAQNAFCAKICSKIITSQFCIVLLNNEVESGREIPNANVNMEYGLMLGFNKYIIPFQLESQSLPFNVSGLDTIKYSSKSFERLAGEAIDAAILATTQDSTPSIDLDQVLKMFLLAKRTLFTPLNTEGDKNIYDLGAPFGFNLLNDLTGFQYYFVGNFTAFRPEACLWRIRMLGEILDARRATLKTRVGVGIATQEQAVLAEVLMRSFQIWAIVTGTDIKKQIASSLEAKPLGYTVELFSLEDVRDELGRLG